MNKKKYVLTCGGKRILNEQIHLKLAYGQNLLVLKHIKDTKETSGKRKKYYKCFGRFITRIPAGINHKNF